ncbi:hypothetical protein [Acinetobacter pollinis]|uniref:hypothetical protein n=1 Tax=Acinetobacter pollinis TaxID=2605270 RepID=UPI0018A3353C|nr:hypothetical protein [Acinetobacter pollinis]MBF7690668.1 hypothetical protein [Acinetobacter pollinis]MBF7698608.1 hypothetical protein [Acinetobacter pollinis]
MAKQIVNIGANANDGSGDAARTAFTKLNQNMNEIYGALGNGTTLFNAIQQGGGTGQDSNKIYIGWSGSSLKAQVDNVDLGIVQTEFSNIMLGIKQTFKSVTNGRSLGTTYTNSTNKPIMVSVILSNVASGTQVIWYVNEGAICASTQTVAVTQLPITFIVPPGQTYKITSSTGSIGSWMELSS